MSETYHMQEDIQGNASSFTSLKGKSNYEHKLENNKSDIMTV